MSWKNVRGHDALVQGFQRVVRRDRLAHAYLFAGPPGVGKKLFAVELAKTLLCEAVPRLDPPDACDRCPACVQVASGSHPDFHVFQRPDERHEFPIDLMREVCETFSLTAARGKARVVIIDDADELSEESANCFLKTLEEPPARSIIVLVCASADRQPTTIVSRCQIVNFARLAPDHVAALLKTDDIAPSNLTELLRACEGSPGLARELSEPSLWDFRRSMLSALASVSVDGVGLGQAWMQFVEEAGKESKAQRKRATLSLGLLLAFLQDALRVRLGLAAPPADAEERRALEAISKRLDADRILDVMERCLEGERHIERRVQLVLAVEALSDALGEGLTTAR